MYLQNRSCRRYYVKRAPRKTNITIRIPELGQLLQQQIVRFLYIFYLTWMWKWSPSIYGLDFYVFGIDLIGGLFPFETVVLELTFLLHLQSVTWYRGPCGSCVRRRHDVAHEYTMQHETYELIAAPLANTPHALYVYAGMYPYIPR